MQSVACIGGSAAPPRASTRTSGRSPSASSAVELAQSSRSFSAACRFWAASPLPARTWTQPSTVVGTGAGAGGAAAGGVAFGRSFSFFLPNILPKKPPCFFASAASAASAAATAAAASDASAAAAAASAASAAATAATASSASRASAEAAVSLPPARGVSVGYANGWPPTASALTSGSDQFVFEKDCRGLVELEACGRVHDVVLFL